MKTTYVCGHRNPDTDSIVSAMAYANLCNALGDNGYVPVRLGHLSDETYFLLHRFGFPTPMRLNTVKTQVRVEKRHDGVSHNMMGRGIISSQGNEKIKKFYR